MSSKTSRRVSAQQIHAYLSHFLSRPLYGNRHTTLHRRRLRVNVPPRPYRQVSCYSNRPLRTGGGFFHSSKQGCHFLNGSFGNLSVNSLGWPKTRFYCFYTICLNNGPVFFVKACHYVRLSIGFIFFCNDVTYALPGSTNYTPTFFSNCFYECLSL